VLRYTPLDSPLGAFDYEFGALDNLDNPLTKSYTNLMYSTFDNSTRGQLLVMNMCRYLPGWSIRYIFEAGSGPAVQKVRENRDHAHRVARELIEQKRRQMVVGQSEKDVLSLLGASHQVSQLAAVNIDIGMITVQSKQMTPKTHIRSYETMRSFLRSGRLCSQDTKQCQKL
jgi:hypothetical protein